MRTLKTLAAAVSAVLLAAGPFAQAQSFKDLKPAAGPLTLVEQGSFFVGGDKRTPGGVGWDQLSFRNLPAGGGDIMSGQMYVQFQKPKGWQRRTPLVLVHGCCLTSKTWETTPDGRMGWAEYFVRKGRATYLAEQAGRARSGVDATVINDVREGRKPPSALSPVLFATSDWMWRTFRLGPAVGQPWPDGQFPTDHVAELQKQIVPDFILYEYPEMFTRFEQAEVNNPTVKALSTLADDLGGVILVGHSQSSAYPSQAVLAGAKNVRGIVQIETGCIGGLKPDQVARLAKVPMLIIVGDHFADPQPPAKCREEMEAINAAGGDMTFLSLPAAGIHGNSHMMMQDRNNLQIADLILDWAATHVERRRGQNR